MITPEFKNNLLKGVKLFKVFEQIQEIIDDFDKIEAHAQDRKRYVDSVEKEVELLRTKKNKISKEVRDLEDRSAVIISNAEQEAAKKINEADMKSKQIISEASLKADNILSELSGKENKIKLLNLDIVLKSEEYNKLLRQIEELKDKFRSML